MHYKLCFFVPETALDTVKQAVFATGAGRQGHYRQCCWQTPGQGQFLPEAAAQPAIGERGELTFVPEYKVEVLCDAAVINTAVAALKAAHPYEEPAFDVIALVDFS